MAKLWRLAKSLQTLRDQLNAASPSRSKVSDGSIGDQAHASRSSDHNPNAAGVVTAVDITHDPANGVDGDTLADRLITDKRVKYVIYDGKIWKARTGKWEKYTGKNPHRHHVHVSVKPELMDDVSAWPWSTVSHPVMEAAPARPVLRLTAPPMTGPNVNLLQIKLKAKGYSVALDSTFGKITESALKQFQVASGLTADGVCGPLCWAELLKG